MGFSPAILWKQWDKCRVRWCNKIPFWIRPLGFVKLVFWSIIENWPCISYGNVLVDLKVCPLTRFECKILNLSKKPQYSRKFHIPTSFWRMNICYSNLLIFLCSVIGLTFPTVETMNKTKDCFNHMQLWESSRKVREKNHKFIFYHKISFVMWYASSTCYVFVLACHITSVR